MKSIIKELQVEATMQNNSVTELLRKSKIVASKLELQEFLAWINNELTGYAETDSNEFPAYRTIGGEPKGFNPYHGWISLVFDDAQSQEAISKTTTNQPIGELEDLYKSGSNILEVPYDAKAQITIGKAVGLQTNFALMIGKSSIAGILDAVRNIILDWSIKLEKEGILGEGISFSKRDKEKAHAPKTVIKINNIDNFIGNIGDLEDNASVNISNVTQNEISKIKDLIDEINKNIENSGLQEEDKVLINKEIEYIEAEIVAGKPLKSKISKRFSIIKRIFEGVSGNIIAQGILYSIGKMF